jgi:hypothetical protein
MQSDERKGVAIGFFKIGQAPDYVWQKRQK